MNVSDMMEMMERDEALHQDLVPWIDTRRVGKHLMKYLNAPLVQEMFYREGKCAVINARYEQKKKLLEHYLAEGNTMGYIFAHERPYRLNAFTELLARRSISDAHYWQTVSAIWTDSENIWQNHSQWRRLWQSTRGEKHEAMDERERAAYKALPEYVTVYRGISNSRQRRQGGLAWTMYRPKAEWFSLRYGFKTIPDVLEGRVSKDNIHAILFGRNEQEAVCRRVVLINKLPK